MVNFRIINNIRGEGIDTTLVDYGTIRANTSTCDRDEVTNLNRIDRYREQRWPFYDEILRKV